MSSLTSPTAPRPRLRAALVSVACAGVIGAASLAIAVAAGWVTLDGHSDRSEIATGILLLAIGAPVSGALHQALSSVERGPEILLGQLVILVAFVLVGSVFDGTYERSAIAFGALLIAGKLAVLCGIGARLTWTLWRRGALDRA